MIIIFGAFLQHMEKAEGAVGKACRAWAGRGTLRKGRGLFDGIHALLLCNTYISVRSTPVCSLSPSDMGDESMGGLENV